MASAAAETATIPTNTDTPSNQVPEAPRGGLRHRGRGGRGRSGRGRGRGGPHNEDGTIGTGDRGGVENRGRGRPPRGGLHMQTPQTSVNSSVAPKTDSAPAEGSTDDAADESLCFICANPVQFYSVTICNHTTCHICSLRMRALYGNKACAHCRTESEFVIFSEDGEKRFVDYDEKAIVTVDENLGIKYAAAQILDETRLLLRYNCPEPDCVIACMGWRDLFSHVRTAHNRVMCRLCTRNKKVFTHEHSLFTPQELRKHERDGDDAPGASDQSGFKGHPYCEFCKERFYSSDELYNHCRQAHERCFICDRSNYSPNQQYYLNYDALVLHFQKDHFMCPEEECLEKKFVVFESKVDLKAHQLEAHPGGLSKAAKRDARRIDISQFEDSRPHQQHRGRGRGRDPNAELGPTRAEMPMRRDEIAYQRTLAVQSAQSTTSRTFGGQLTAPPEPAFAARPPPQAQAQPVPVQTAAIPVARPPPPPPPAAPVDQFPRLGLSSTRPAPASSSTSTPATPVVTEETKKARHVAVVERASTLLKNDPTKIEHFRRYVGEYRSSVKTAREICDAFWSLFDIHANELGKLIKELAELYEDERKRIELLAAWNSWKAVNEDYPPFAGISSTSSNAQAGSNRVLKIKSSTTPSARSARQGAWGTAASSAPSSANRQTVGPSVASSSASLNRGTDLWVTPAASSSTLTAIASRMAQPPPQTAPTSRILTIQASQVPSNNISSSSTRSLRTSAAEFPSLPPKKPAHNFGPVIRNAGSGGRGMGASASAANPWGSGSGTGSGATQNIVPSNNDDEGGGGGKKKKGKVKQTLFHFG